jgi:hypothetical protein
MLTGAELATIIGIVAGFATCIDSAARLYDRVKKKREHARVQRLARQLGVTLQGGHVAIQDALDRLRGLGHGLGRGQGK